MRRLFDRPIAHRGLHDRSRGIIENSRSAFEAAIVHGYAIECDIQLSSDGVPFIFHDDTFERLTDQTGSSGERPIGDLQALVLRDSATGDAPQRLSEFLEQAAGRTTLQIELKRQRTAERTLQLASAVANTIAQFREGITLESFDPRLLAALRAEGVTAPIGIITYDYHDERSGTSASQRFALRHLLHWPWTRFDFISCHTRNLDLPAVRFFRSSGMEVTAWTIKSEQDASEALVSADQIVFEGYLPEIG
jgi:glycerophosphoryl diester phosphodiesterase